MASFVTGRGETNMMARVKMTGEIVQVKWQDNLHFSVHAIRSN